MNARDTDFNMLDLAHLFVDAQELHMQLKRTIRHMNLVDKDAEQELAEAADMIGVAALKIAGEFDPESLVSAEREPERVKSKAKKAKKVKK